MIGIFVRATAYAGLIARKQGCYPADNDTAIAPFWAVAGDQQELLAIASRDKIFGRHAEALGEEIGDSLRPPVRQAEIVHGRADGVCVAFDQEHLTRVLPYNVRHNGGYTLEPVLLIGPISQDPNSKWIVSMFTLRMRSRRWTLATTSSKV